MSAMAQRSFRQVGTRLVKICSIGAWLFMASTPLIVAFCALHG